MRVTMDIGSVIRSVKNRIRKQYPFFCFWVCFLLVQTLSAADPSALKIEEAQCAFQERHQMIFGESVSWPTNALGQPAPEYPSDGFYETDLSNSVRAAALVADLATKFDGSGLLWNFTSATGGDIEGLSAPDDSEEAPAFASTFSVEGTSLSSVPLLGDRIKMPLASDVTPDNYPAQFQRLAQGLCAAKYVALNAWQVGPGGSDTVVESRFGRSYSDEVDGHLFCTFENDPTMCSNCTTGSCAGTFYLDFGQTPVPDHWNFAVVGDLPQELSLVSTNFTGDRIEVPWEVTGGCNNEYCVLLLWNLTFTCEEELANAQNNWANAGWQDNEEAHSFISIQTHTPQALSSGVISGHASVLSVRGRIYANLTNFNGTARCYLAANFDNAGVDGADLELDPPVRADQTWHFYAAPQPGTEWQSPVLADYMPPFTQLGCGDSHRDRGWHVHKQAVIITPDFHHNIESCEPCSTCNGDRCTPGSASTSLTGGALNLNIALGLGSFGKPAGELSLYTLRPIPNLISPSALAYHTSIRSEVFRDTNNVLRQVHNTQALVDIVTSINTGYEIRFYTPADAGAANSFGFYEPVGTPFKVFAIENPDANGATSNQLRITESGDGISRTSDFVWSDTDQKWTLITGNGLRKECLTSERVSAFIRRETYTITEGVEETLVYKEQRSFQEFNWGEEMVEKIVDPDGAALTTAWNYYEREEDDGDNYSHLKQQTDPYGYCEEYAYDSLGRVVGETSIYLDAPFEGDPIFRVVSTIYETNDPAVTVIETIQGKEVSRRCTVYRPGETREIQALTPHAEWDDPSNLVTITRSYLAGSFEGKLLSVTHPDGTMSIYQYEYIESDGGSNLITSVSTGQANGEGAAIVNGSKAVTRVNQSGTIVREETHDIADGHDTLIAWSQAVAFDDFGRATQINYSDATSVSTTYGCCGVLSITDREGTITTYAYDALKRLSSTTRAGITTSNSYDAAGHVLSTVRIGSDNSAITLNTSTYDMTGRLTSSTDAVTNTTSYFEFVANGHLVKSNVFASGSCRVETFYQDGQLLSISGSAAHGLRYAYGVDADGQFIQEIKLNVDGSETSEWTKTYTDMAGRTHKTVYAGGSFGQSFYSSSGQLVKQVDPDGVTILFAYNDKGELETTAIDMDRNGLIDFGGTDRITKTGNSVVTAYGMTVRRTMTSVWTTNNVDASSIVSVNDVSADGLQSWSISYGLTNHVQTVYSGNGQHTVTATNPDGSYTVAQYQDGRLVSAIQYGNDNAQVSATLYRYDSHGRLGTQTDARTGETMYGYNDADQLVSVTTPVPATGQSAQTIQYEYDAMGRRTIVALPDNGTVTTEYFDTGEPKKIYGVRTYAVEYTYDYAGRMKTMKTWKDYAGDIGIATTTWNYDAARGFLSSKVYDDLSSVTYSNSAAGRLLFRAWARGIVTSYGHNDAGDLTVLTYSDLTPSVSMVYDRRGRRVAVTNGIDVCTYTYNAAGQLLTESFPTSDVIVTNTYDSLLRRSSLRGATVSVAYSYDSASRLSAVTNDIYTATYTYLPNSPLVNNIVFAASGITKMTITKSYDNVNRLTSISSSAPNAFGVSSHSYSYNTANQRTRVDLADGSYWIYQYDPLGQVTSGKKYWSDGTPVAGQQFEYGFDTIGNRTNTVTNGRSAGYSPNNLNQYTQRTVPGYLDILGTAASNATVTVNLQPTNRKGDYFHTTLQFSNTSSAIYTNIWVVGVRKNAGTNQQDVVTQVPGHEFLPRSPEVFGYDADGNLTNDGRWACIHGMQRTDWWRCERCRTCPPACHAKNSLLSMISSPAELAK